MMKKVALSLVGVLAVAAFAPEASALPVFARQTGMACNACHFQHFPLLNGFGRSFKASGYTLMGAQGKVEGEELSLPDRLNMAVLTTAGIEQQTGANAGGNGRVSKTVHVPGNGGELSLFFGGKVAENVGFLSEFVAAGTGTGMNSAKLPMLFEVAEGTRAGLVFLSTAGQGPSHSFELLNTGATGVHIAPTMPGLGGQHFKAASAAQYLGTSTGAVGASAVVVNPDLFFVNIGRYGITTAQTNAFGTAGTASTANTLGGGTSNQLQSTYVRAGATDIMGSGVGVGVMMITGKDAATYGVETKATVVDAQWMADDVAGMSLLVFGSYGTAPKGTNNTAGNATTGTVNAYNAKNINASTSLNVGASLGVAKGTTVQGALRKGNNGDTTNISGDNAVQVGVTYELAQNVELSLMNTHQFGSAWRQVNTARAGQNATSLKLEAVF
jgi:hypothetical protein